MEYNLKQNDETKKILAAITEGNTLTLTMEEKDIQAMVTRISDHHIHMDLDDGNGRKGINVYVADDNGKKIIVINGMPYYIEDDDSHRFAKNKKRSGANIPDVVTPPMPAIVISVLVNRGDRIEKGQKLVVLSAMKMETTLTAPFGGTVTKVNAKEGDKVAPGDILVDIEKEE
ncbi:MAG: biotin/lipoyl-binding protein [Proteobacteria bacterium]|nr:biotin/lipoyl-binding protein [Pseudomonadota bacterium]